MKIHPRMAVSSMAHFAVLCDGKHFRAGAQRAKRVALSFVDDATRMGLGVVVGTSENTAL